MKRPDAPVPMMTLDEKIAQAERHVEIGRRVIERQRALVARHNGWDSAADLLACFERTQQMFGSDLADLLKRKLPRPERL